MGIGKPLKERGEPLECGGKFIQKQKNSSKKIIKTGIKKMEKFAFFLVLIFGTSLTFRISAGTSTSDRNKNSKKNVLQHCKKIFHKNLQFGLDKIRPFFAITENETREIGRNDSDCAGVLESVKNSTKNDGEGIKISNVKDFAKDVCKGNEEGRQKICYMKLKPLRK